MQRGIDYANDIRSGKNISGKYIKLAVERYFEMQERVERGELLFYPEKVEKVIDFIQTLKHFKGASAGKHFILSPWQVFFIICVYGFYYYDDERGCERRLTTSVFLLVARKNGKTAFACALAAYGLVYDDEAAPEIINIANSNKQAGIAFKFLRKFIGQLDPKNTYFKINRRDIEYHINDGMATTLSSDVSGGDGYDVHLGLVDEFHQADTTEVLDVLSSATNNRVNSIIMTITTAGIDKSKPCYEFVKNYEQALENNKLPDNTLALLYQIDENDDYTKPETCAIKANPNLGYTVFLSDIKQQVQQCAVRPSYELECKVKFFNQFGDASEIWIPMPFVRKCFASKKLNIKDYCNEDYLCYCGMDLSSTRDMSALCWLFVHKDREKYVFIPQFFVPESPSESSRTKHLYKKWARDKRTNLIETPGNVIDYDFIQKEINKVADIMDIEKIYYDRYNATQLVINLTNDGLPLEACDQSIRGFSPPTKELERMIIGNGSVADVIIDPTPVMEFCFQNSSLQYDSGGNIKPIKYTKTGKSSKSSAKKIDGVIAAIQALAAHLKIHKPELFVLPNIYGTETTP